TARIRAATRRHANQTARAGRFAGGPLVIEFRTRTATLEGEPVKMSPKEFEILKALALSAGQVVTHRKLLAAGWGDEKGDGQY
ncbi:response regulator transcription factor, partial [Escherichia coli]|uniref:response regulator transcription factor n=1 Tax=Escherichia coli TaxID=562 RepID=UPI0039DF5F79